MAESKVSETDINIRKPSVRKVNELNPLDLVAFTIDPTLDSPESRNVLSSKTVAGKKMLANCRKTH